MTNTIYYCARRYDEAVEQLEKTLQMEPQFGPAYAFVCEAYAKKGQYEQAIAAAQEPVKFAPKTSVYLTILGSIYAASGKKSRAEEILQEMKEVARQQYVQPSYMAMLYCALGEPDQAFEWLEKAYADRDDRLIFVLTDPMLDPLRPDQRFQQLVRRVGLPQ